jgi:hypothetical protein
LLNWFWHCVLSLRRINHMVLKTICIDPLSTRQPLNITSRTILSRSYSLKKVTLYKVTFQSNFVHLCPRSFRHHSLRCEPSSVKSKRTSFSGLWQNKCDSSISLGCQLQTTAWRKAHTHPENTEGSWSIKATFDLW